MMKKWLIIPTVILAMIMLAGCDKAETGHSGDISAENEGNYSKTTFIIGDDGTRDNVSTEFYDEHGSCISKQYCSGNITYEYEYNKDGKVRCMYEYRDLPDEFVTNRTEYEYENGLKTKETAYKDDELISVTTYEYNAHGDEILRRVENKENGTVSGHFTEYEYDMYGQWWTAAGFFDLNNAEPIGSETRTLDKIGNVTELHRIEGYSDTLWVMTYDNKNRMTSLSITSKDGDGEPRTQYQEYTYSTL